ncbi:hypothetical protein ACWDUC_38505 [Streptomyces tricolor]
MNSQLSLRTTVLLLAGGASTYLALVNPALGTALLVGMAAITVLHTLIDRG